MKRVLVQGYGKFGQYAENPSEQIVQALATTSIDGVELHTSVLPASLEVVRPRIPELIEEVAPDVWLGIGLWGGHPSVSIERYAANRMDFHVADESGAQPRDTKIDPEGGDGWWVPIDDRAIVRAWAEAGIPGHSSEDAGAHLCNLSLYIASATMRRIGGPAQQVGFVHVPMTPRMVRDPATQPSVELGTLVTACRIAVEVCAATAARS